MQTAEILYVTGVVFWTIREKKCYKRSIYKVKVLNAILRIFYIIKSLSEWVFLIVLIRE